MSPILLLLYGFLALVLLVVMVAYNYLFRVYFMAQMAQAPIPLPRVAKAFLRTPRVRSIVKAYIAATKAGVETDFEALVDHVKAGGSAQRVVATLVEAKQNGGAVTFEKACAFDIDEHGVIEFPPDQSATVGENNQRS